MGALQELDMLLARLEGAAPASEGDAITAVLADAPRATAVRSLRDDAVMQRFRAELAAGQVEVATVKGFLDLLTQVLDVALAGRG